MHPSSYESGLERFLFQQELVKYECPDPNLSKLLPEGFLQELVYLIYGEHRIIADILIKTAVYSYKDKNFIKKVAFVDSSNRFNPYTISKQAVGLELSPKNVLEVFLYARAFTWDQLVELLENRISKLDNIKMLLISGITAYWPNYEYKSFDDLKRAIDGIKKIMAKLSPLIILTAPAHQYSDVKPVGGTNLTHFGHVLIKIESNERYRDYILIQHPSQPEKKVRYFFPKKPKRKIAERARFYTLDRFL